MCTCCKSCMFVPPLFLINVCVWNIVIVYCVCAWMQSASQWASHISGPWQRSGRRDASWWWWGHSEETTLCWQLTDICWQSPTRLHRARSTGLLWKLASCELSSCSGRGDDLVSVSRDVMEPADGFHVQKSDADADLSHDQNYQLLAYCGYCNSTYLLIIKQLQTN